MPNDKDLKISIESKAADFFDWNTLITVFMLTAIGLISIYSATFASGMNAYFYKQLSYAGIGFAVLAITIFIPERLLRVGAPFFYASTIFLLLLVLVIGHVVYGTKGWLVVGGFSLQPSEIAKLGALALIAMQVSRPGANVQSIRDLATLFAILILPIYLIHLEPDDGSATVLMAMTLGVLAWAGFDLFILFMVVGLPSFILISLFGTLYYIIGLILFSIITLLFRRGIIKSILVIAIFAAVGYGGQIVVEKLQPHQKARIEVFLDPSKDPKGKGYNVIQSMMAVGSGGITGKGFLEGTQTQLRYIPKQWTDFIFCVPTEEFGFIGGSLVILLLINLVYRGIKIASEIRSPFMSTICVGVSTIFLYHTFINVGFAIGLMPVMGIPLPFLSAGGSSLIVNLFMAGLLINAYRSAKMSSRGKR